VKLEDKNTLLKQLEEARKNLKEWTFTNEKEKIEHRIKIRDLSDKVKALDKKK
jgi:hypothetical protein